MKKIRIAPSVLSADFTDLKSEMTEIESAGADWLHVDVMDGHFVPNLTIGPFIVEALSRCTSLPLDVHLMITNPDFFIPEFAKAGADRITVHVENSTQLKKTLQLIKKYQKKVGISLNPHTPISKITSYLAKVDQVLVMTVNPGFGGQKAIPEAFEKISELSKFRKMNNLKFLISVDGGINETNAKIAIKNGADVLVAGSYIFKSKNYKKAVQALR